ncbi:Uncharacterised protein [Sphingobacterium spiritivorum]|uniref:DUF4142 domain-containing protein n=1 Tax=Sphingobacterium spiritivorum TaxID=258 RepID=A0A380BQ33_SPHSI|nr:hypothetical protein [Sphingobacterium spiritivorum]SUJ04571.1 Uncharacterised protein [Sphingobacterium spiritivorum]
MKLNTLFVVAVIGGSTLFASCSNKTAEQNQLKYTHTSLVDGDAYRFFQTVGEKIPYELAYAEYAASVSSDAKVKSLAAKIKEVYGSLIPHLDSVATEVHVDFPIRGAQAFQAPAQQTAATDSTAVTSKVASYSDAAFLKHAEHEQALIKEQFDRVSRNTNVKLQKFAADHAEALEEVYHAAGVKHDEHAHH